MFARPRLLALLPAVLVLFAAGCGRARHAGEVFPKAPVVLISVDTLRSDHLPFYGYLGVETPALTALRKDAILFEKAYAHVPLTLPSHATVMTGRVPGEHGIHDNLGYHLRKGIPTLAELLKKAGYATGGAVSCYVLKNDSDIGRGFDVWDDAVEAPEAHAALGRVQRPGGETEARLAAWLSAQPAKQPLFAFLHLYEPHTPYEPPEPFKSRYTARPYDGEIAAADAIVGRFVALLKQRGLYDPALVIFFSDHGEALGEHGEAEHGMFLYRETLQVPLLVKLPGSRRAGTSVATPVALSDIFATVGTAVGLPDFSPPAGTASLLSFADGAPSPPRRLLAETFFPRIHFGWSELTSILEGSWHYIEAPKPEIYDLAADPGETKNLLAERPDALRTLRPALLAARPSFEAPGETDPEARRKLASLGYLSAGTPGTGTLDDPKDRIGTFETLRTGLGEMTGGRPEKAHAIFAKLLAENPRMLDVWDMESRVLISLGKPEEALAALKKTVELAPENAKGPYLVEVANLCLQLGKWDDAQTHVEALRALGDPAAEDIASRAALGRGDAAAAETSARAVLENPRGSDQAHVRAHLVLGRIAVKRGDLEGARSHADEAQRLSAGEKFVQSGLHMLRGDVLARSGQIAEAEREFLEEIRLYPDRLDARIALATLYASADRRGDARRVIVAFVSRQPTPEAFLLGMKTFHSTEDFGGEAELKKEARRLFPKDPRFATKG